MLAPWKTEIPEEEGFTQGLPPAFQIPSPNQTRMKLTDLNGRGNKGTPNFKASPSFREMLDSRTSDTSTSPAKDVPEPTSIRRGRKPVTIPLLEDSEKRKACVEESSE